MISRTFAVTVLGLIAAMLFIGCGGSAKKADSGESAKQSGEREDGVVRKKEASGSARAAAFNMGAADPAPLPGVDAKEHIDRKIVYKATLKVQVEDFAAAQDKIEELIDDFHGVLEKEEINGSPGVPRSGTWKIRVRPGELRAFQKAVLKLGEPQEDRLGSEDVTEEYYDLESRIKNKESELESYRAMQKDAKTIPDALPVTKELAKAQADCDSLKTRQHLLQNLTELTTVEVTLRERGVYVPDESPAFGVTIGRVLGGSVSALTHAGKFLVYCGVALAPWLPVILLVSLPPYVWWRRRRARVL